MEPAAFAVTTRSRLRGAHLFPLMFFASKRIRRQLAATPGCVRFASIVASPRDFWTITVWESRDKMFAFMRSGAHEDFMWQVGKWLESFWLMRWLPTTQEQGYWDGARLGTGDDGARTSRPRTAQEKAALEAALEALPVLKDSAGPEGAPTYASSPAARRHRKAVEGGAAVMLRIRVPSLRQAPRAWWEIRRVGRRLGADPSMLRSATGVSGLREYYALAVLRDEQSCARFLEEAEQQRVSERWGEHYWGMHWNPMNEFGHWDGMRMRREALGSPSIPVPTDAARAAVPPEDG